MSATIDDEIVVVDTPFPKLIDVSALDDLRILVSWNDAKPVSVDLAPTIWTFKVYAPLRENRALFESVHLVNESVIAWGDDDSIDMHVSEIERLASEAMDTADFQAFLKEMNLTWDGAAAALGVSRRMIGYYAKGHAVPRYIALACAQIASRRDRLARL